MDLTQLIKGQSSDIWDWRSHPENCLVNLKDYCRSVDRKPCSCGRIQPNSTGGVPLAASRSIVRRNSPSK